MRRKRTLRCFLGVLAFSTAIVGAAEASGVRDAGVSPTKGNVMVSPAMDPDDEAAKPVPEPSTALIGAIGVLMLLRRRKAV